MKLTAVDQLRIHWMARLAVPDGGGVASAVKFFIDKNIRLRIAQEAQLLAEHSINVVRSAPDNPFKTDEEIAQAIIDELEKKKALQRPIVGSPSNSRS